MKYLYLLIIGVFFILVGLAFGGIVVYEHIHVGSRDFLFGYFAAFMFFVAGWIQIVTRGYLINNDKESGNARVLEVKNESEK